MCKRKIQNPPHWQSYCREHNFRNIMFFLLQTRIINYRTHFLRECYSYFENCPLNLLRDFVFRDKTCTLKYKNDLLVVFFYATNVEYKSILIYFTTIV